MEEHYYFIIGAEAYLHQKAEHLFECYPAELTGADKIPKPILRLIFKFTLTGGKFKTFLHMIGWGRHSVEIQVSKETSLRAVYIIRSILLFVSEGNGHEMP